MKRIWTLLCGALVLLTTQLAFAQGKVYVQESGRSTGSVSSIELNGITYVDVQATARKLGAHVELFAASKQAKITTKGFFAILTGSLDEIIVNGKHETIRGPVEVRGGKLMAPVDVFLMPSFQRAVNRFIEFEGNTFIVERRFNVELTDKLLNAKDNLLVFSASKNLTFSTQQTNPHTVIVTLKDVVLKRDEYKRLRTGYVASYSAEQVRGDAQLKVILGDQAKDWSFTQVDDTQWAFRAGAAKGAPVIPSKTPVLKSAAAPVMKAEPLTPSIISDEEETQEEPATDEPASQEPAATEPASQPAAEEDDFEEMVLTAIAEPAVPAAPAPAAPAAAAVTAPAIKAENHPLAITTARKKMRIVVDPGHGGKDAGAVRGKYREKDWNLAVGKELAALLKKGKFEVKITRDTDVFIALSERSKIANNFKADLFVSVHVNATKTSQANGFQVYFRSEKATDREAAETAALENEAMQYEEVHYNFVDALLQSLAKNEYINESSKLAGYVKNSVYKQPGIGIAVDQKNAIRQANFYVLKGVQCPSILVEMGFISSPKDRAKLSQSSVQKKMAQGIYNGIVNYAKTEGWLQ